jgi:hypothetical protein
MLEFRAPHAHHRRQLPATIAVVPPSKASVDITTAAAAAAIAVPSAVVLPADVLGCKAEGVKLGLGGRPAPPIIPTQIEPHASSV